MRFSIVIPTLNEEKLLPELLKVINLFRFNKNESYELIISDGGSSDRTVEFAMKYADKIVYYKGLNKQGIAAGRNAGAKQASGEILIFLASDIKIESPEIFFSEIEQSFHNPKIIAMTGIVKIFQNEETLKDKIAHTIFNSYFYVLNKIGVGMGRGEIQIIKRRVFEKLSGYNENLAAGEDFDLFKRARRLGYIFFNKNIVIRESPRRYRKKGYWNIFFIWTLNALFVIFKKKSLSRDWEQVR